MKTTLEQLTMGVGFLNSGLTTLMRAKGLKRYAIIPFLIDVAILFFGMAWGASQVLSLATLAAGYIVSVDSGFLYYLVYYPLILLFGLVFVILLVFAVYLLAGVIAGPFNSLLAERALMHFGVIEDRPFQVMAWLKLSVRMLIVSLLKAVLFLIVGIVLFILAFVPGFNLASSLGAMMILAFDSMDYSFEIDGLGDRKSVV